MKLPKPEDIDTIGWIGGTLMLGMGSWSLWGWQASAVILGAIFSIWPLVKTVLRHLPHQNKWL